MLAATCMIDSLSRATYTGKRDRERQSGAGDGNNLCVVLSTELEKIVAT